ncbi:MAG: hypothetical protein HON70_30655 [Lentisphaerae bacterium]|nr:hypothetical protein [Lentisphaerota bacterium]
MAFGVAGCSKKKQAGGSVPGTPSIPATASVQYCDFKEGPEDAKVTVRAFYPGRHEDTLSAVKGLVDMFPGQVKVEIVDWRREEGLKQRDATGLVCAGVVINDKNAFDLDVGGATSKVLFVRGIDGEWTKDDLEAAVRQEIMKKME